MTDRVRTIGIVEKLRPVTTVDDRWPSAARDAALQRLLIAVKDDLPAPRRHVRRRRLLLVGALTTGLVASSAGIAAAAGLLPESFTKPLSFWTTETGGAVNVQTARRLAQAPGPDGTVLSVWSATGKDGTVCIAPMFESPGALDRPAPTRFQLAGGQCARLDQQQMSHFGDGGGSADDRGIHTMWVSAGNAVRAHLLLSDGTVRPALPAAGMFFFWYEANDTVEPPTLIGYDAAGSIVGRLPMPNLTR